MVTKSKKKVNLSKEEIFTTFQNKNKKAPVYSQYTGGGVPKSQMQITQYYLNQHDIDE